LNTVTIWKTGASDTLVNRELELFNKECDDIENPSLSNKVKILCQILDAAREAQDKVLVFSQSIPTLNFLDKLLKSQGRSLSRLDGKTEMGNRQTMTKNFNTDNTEIYLISTTAGGLGLNLPGANRVVIFDFKFNPIEEEQAIGRAYRIGQKKPTFVYRLICDGTFEEVIQNKTIYKTQLASQVVDKKSVIAYAKKKMSEYLFEPKLVEQHDISEFTGMDPQVLDKVLLSEENSGVLLKILQSDTFAQDDKDVLDAAEQKEVKKMLDDEKLKRTNPQAYAAKQAADATRNQELARAHIRQEAARMQANARAQTQIQQANAIRANMQPQHRTVSLNSSGADTASIIPPISTPNRAVETRILPPTSQSSPSIPVVPSSTQTAAESTLLKSAELDLPPTEDTSLAERQPHDPIRPPVLAKHTVSPMIRRGQSPILGAGTRAGSTSSESTPSRVESKSPNHKRANTSRSGQSSERSRHDVRNVGPSKRSSSPATVLQNPRPVKLPRRQAPSDAVAFSDAAGNQEFLHRNRQLTLPGAQIGGKAPNPSPLWQNHDKPPTSFSKFKSAKKSSSDASDPPESSVELPLEKSSPQQVQSSSQPASVKSFFKNLFS
jgi:superfamily II DNA/RNA helicase